MVIMNVSKSNFASEKKRYGNEKSITYHDNSA